MNGENISHGPQPDTSPEVEFARSVADKIQDYARRGQAIVLSPAEADYARQFISWHEVMINALAKGAETTEADTISIRRAVVSDILDNMSKHADNNWSFALSGGQVRYLGGYTILVEGLARKLVDNHNGHLEAEETPNTIGQ